jgi:hypothetical protein
MNFFRKKETNVVSDSDTDMTMTTSNANNPDQPVELGTIQYVNLTPDGRHGDMEVALQVASETGKPLFVNFVEWSG